VQLLRDECGVSHLSAVVLAARGFTDPQEVSDFLQADFTSLSDPFELPDIERAVARIRSAVDEGEKIRIFGDYDCDGITGTALLLSVLRDMGATADCRIPVRLREGYGLNAAAVDEAVQDEVGLLITVDCGITARDEVNRAREGGVDVVITDHHQPGGALPRAEAVINPQREDSDYPFSDLAGVGVCYQLGRALTGDDLTDELDLVAVGTVADMVPLVQENRLLTRSGLQQLRRSQRPLLNALARVSSVDLSYVTEEDIAYRLAPRINAPGRLYDASPVVRALLTGDRRTAACAAKWCDRANRKRRHLTDRASFAARLQVETTSEGEGAGIVLCGEDWHAGVVGLVATRIAEQYRRPSIVLTSDPEDPEMLKGSGRGIAESSLLDALRRCEAHLHEYGGHASAAGLSIRRGDLADFRDAFNRAVREILDADQVIPTLKVDAQVPLRLIYPEAVQDLQRLGPFGMKNPRPMFLSRDVRVRRARPVGADDRHLSLELEQEALKVIGFHLAEEWRSARGPSKIDMIYSPGVSWWQGRPRAELVLEALRPAGASDQEVLQQRLRRRWRFLHRLYPDRDMLRQIYRLLRRGGAGDRNGEVAAAADADPDTSGSGLFDPEGEDAGWILENMPGLDREGLYCALDILSEMSLIAPLTKGGRQLWLPLPDPPSEVTPEDSPTYARSKAELHRVRDAAEMQEPDAATIARTLYRFDG